MYKIGDFSKITKLTVKALRYYDEERILTPSHRDNENMYRYYDENDYQKALLIAALREFGFSISEIKDVLAGYQNPEDLSYYLEEKKSILESRIAREKELIQKITLSIQIRKREDAGMSYKVEIREIAPVMVASIRYRGKYSDVGKYIGKIFQAVKGDGAGAPFSLYYEAEFKEDDADIELCVPTKKLIKDNSVTARVLPALKAICTTHVGSYEKLSSGYKALYDYANEHGIVMLTPYREIYQKGPGMIFRGNENNYVTELIIPIEVKE